MKIFPYKSLGVSKGFILAASAYRRSVKHHYNYSELDFSMEALKQQYDHETYGGSRPDAKINGYTYGKSIFDITVKALQEDLIQGHICKYEILNDACALKRKLIRDMMPGKLFAWDKNG